jgi:hypothetical protein
MTQTPPDRPDNEQQLETRELIDAANQRLKALAEKEAIDRAEFQVRFQAQLEVLRKKPMTNPPDRLDVLIEQIGRLTEAVTVGFQDSRVEASEVRAALTEGFENSRADAAAIRADMTAGFADIKETIAQQAIVVERQYETARLQAESVARLIQLLDGTHGG